MDFTTEAATVRINNNNRFWKWCSGILGALLVTAIVALAGTIKQMEHLKTTQEEMAKDVEANAKWIDDWSNVLRVPERDQRQDSAIEELRRAATEIQRRIAALEGH